MTVYSLWYVTQSWEVMPPWEVPTSKVQVQTLANQERKKMKKPGLIKKQQFSSVQLLSVSNSFSAHGLQHASLPCPSPTSGASAILCPLSRWCHPTISSLSPSPPAFNLSQHQGLFQWVSSSHQVPKVLEFQLKLQSFQWIFRTDFL